MKTAAIWSCRYLIADRTEQRDSSNGHTLPLSASLSECNLIQNQKNQPMVLLRTFRMRKTPSHILCVAIHPWCCSPHNPGDEAEKRRNKNDALSDRTIFHRNPVRVDIHIVHRSTSNVAFEGIAHIIFEQHPSRSASA